MVAFVLYDTFVTSPSRHLTDIRRGIRCVSNLSSATTQKSERSDVCGSIVYSLASYFLTKTAAFVAAVYSTT